MKKLKTLRNALGTVRYCLFQTALWLPVVIALYVNYAMYLQNDSETTNNNIT